MHTEHHKWFSNSLNKDMELKVYGHYGKPFIVFPCSQGRFFDFEGMGMIDKISHFIDSGKIKLYTIDSVDSESWYNFSAHPADRNNRHEQYDNYVANEVIPFIRNHSSTHNERPIATGASMGAYHAVNFFLKHPDLCGGTIALSGLYRLNHSDFQLSNDDIQYVYYNSPIHFLPNVTDGNTLDWYRKSNVVVCCGQGSWEEQAVIDSKDLENSFKQKNVPVWFDYWGSDVNHDWPWWYIQMNYFLDKLYS